MTPSVSVLIPLTESRRAMFESICLPSIIAPFPIEILIDDANEPANVKRNRLARSAKNHFFFFCDDDVILAPDALKRLYDGFGSQLDFSSFAYGDFLTINHPTRGMGVYRSRDWDVNALRRENYISTMSLVRSDDFPGFDESLDRFQDWDLWLGVADYSLPAIDWIRDHIPTNELFFVDLTKGINRPDKSYDVVMCTEVIEHMEDPQAAIAELARIARQRLIITVPYGDEADKSVEHIWALWLDDLYELLNPYGKVFLTVSNGGSNIVAACHIRQA